MDTKLLFTSHNLESLVDELLLQLDRNIFSRSLIVIPSLALKEWLQVQLCQRSVNQAWLGLEFILWPQAIHRLAPQLHSPGKGDLLAASWDSIEQEKKKTEFALQKLRALSEWNLYGPKEHPFRELFETQGWIPLFESLEFFSPDPTRPLFLFGIDSLPPAVYRFFLRHPTAKLFRFSPCAMFWEDVRSASERSWILKKWRSNSSLEELLKNTHPLLANWGVVGRKMLSLDEELETEENYEIEEPTTVLQQLKIDFLTLEKPHEKRFLADSSISLIKAGNSRLREVEAVRDAIIQSRKEGILFEEMCIYAPDIEPYAPLLTFAFAHPELSIPIRVASREFHRKSSFYQALMGLLDCVNGYWHRQELLSLFEINAFAHWKIDLKKLKQWTEWAHIRWGADQEHRTQMSGKEATGTGSWRDGLNTIVDGLIRLQPEQTAFLPWSDADLFERFVDLFERLQKALFSMREPRSLKNWAETIENLAKEFLLFNENCPFDRSVQKSLSRFLETLRAAKSDSLLPLDLVKTLFDPERIEERSGLHSIRASSLEKGAVLPAKIVFLIGMDEESFPRHFTPSSSMEKLPENVWDRYLFLQTLFAAKQQLVISYRNQSQEDGKTVHPSLLVEELLEYVQETFVQPIPCIHVPSSPINASTFQSPFPADHRAALAAKHGVSKSFLLQPISLSGSSNVSLQTLNRFFRHPLLYYLEEVLHLSFPKPVSSYWEEFECSHLMTHQFLQHFLNRSETETIDWPLGLFGEEAKLSLKEKKEQFQSALNEWGIHRNQIQSIELNTPLPPGTSHLVVPHGVLHTGEDSIRGILKRWPEMLAALCHTGSNQIFSLRSSRVRRVNDPVASLQKLRELFSQFQSTPLFFHPDWADDLLRKERNAPLEKSEDPTVRWIIERNPQMNFLEEWQKSKEILKQSLDSLIALFPVRTANAKV